MNEEENDIKTRLLTLLNVSHLKYGLRPIDENSSLDGPSSAKRVKLNAQRANNPSDASGDNTSEPETSVVTQEEKADEPEGELEAQDDVEEEKDETNDPFWTHFGSVPINLTDAARSNADSSSWKSSSTRSRALGGTLLVDVTIPSAPSTPNSEASPSSKLLSPKLVAVNQRETKSCDPAFRSIRSSLLDLALRGKDIYLPHVGLTEHDPLRRTISLVLLNHILKIRRTILKNNDRLAAAASSSAAASAAKKSEKEDDISNDPHIQDQGFTRPSTLVLLPFRNSALAFLQSFIDHFASSISGLSPSPFSSSSPSNSNANANTAQKTQEAQVQNYTRFHSQYTLPPTAIDKLSPSSPSSSSSPSSPSSLSSSLAAAVPSGKTYPPDHIQTFQGNIDDNFRMGVKVTKKSLRMFEKFYGADLIVASPLGLRMVLEKEGADFLSSIEIVVVDQMDALLMQNWDHVQFIFQHLNKTPRDSHDADFSRIKPWLLNEQGEYIRQTILLSQYETPETRALFNSLKNVDGKVRSMASWEGVKVPEGIDQKFTKFETLSIKEEADKRFEHFTTKLFPATLRSAVESSCTVIFVPSYFDFVRVQNWLNKQGHGASCAFISEYTSNQDISRARQAFFSGSKSFLVISERFYFFRRYKLRGIRNILFYAPPDHPQFYAELLAMPFLDNGVEASDVGVKVLYSRYDLMRLERIVGSEGVGALVE